MKNTRAFTVVELLVVITVIAIVVTIGVFAFSNVRKTSRDSTRKGNVTVISEALERYYDRNGEYPSVVSLANNGGVTAQTIATKLGVTVQDLKMPRHAANVNPITSTDPPTNDNISYVASSVINNTACQSTATGGCDRFTLKYVPENSATVSVESRRRDRPVNP